MANFFFVIDFVLRNHTDSGSQISSLIEYFTFLKKKHIYIWKYDKYLEYITQIMCKQNLKYNKNKYLRGLKFSFALK